MMECPNCQSELYTEYHPKEDVWSCQNCGWLWTDKITALSGYPDCPACGVMLKLRSMPAADETYWYCPNKNCDIQWFTADIIKAQNQIRRADYAELYQAAHQESS